jgi:uncharacterized protein GlcG (DUF336 family)
MRGRKTLLKRLTAMCFALLLVNCGGSGGDGSTPQVCTNNCAPPAAPTDFLTIADVERVIAQAVHEANAQNAKATIAVVDRVGNVLAVYRMTGAATTFRINSGRNVSGGLENIDVLPDTLAAITKAITGAYLSSNGNAFSTRTASQIVQEHFNPRELNQPSGPLFGVQFSQLSCSDLMRRETDGSVGPKRSPLGLAADAGGLPLYKDNRLVGGVGVLADGVYGLDLDITNIDNDKDEVIAVAASTGFAAPDDIRGNRITADGRTFRYVDSTSILSNATLVPAFATLNSSIGSNIAVPGFFNATIRQGVSFGNSASGIRALTATENSALASLNAYIVVDSANNNRYPSRAGTDTLLSAAEATTIMAEALKVANRARAQIRRPLSTQAQVTIAIVDTNGEVLTLARTPDAPVFGTDVSLQKARSALLLSLPNAAANISALASANYVGANAAPVTAPNAARSFAQQVAGFRAFLNDPSALANGVAYSNRAIGNLARPYFPDGITGTGAGPLSTSIAQWSPFNVGFQLDLSYNAIIAAAVNTAAAAPLAGCTGLARAKNGIQIFPGAVPIYRGNQLVGAIGVSGDGVDQDDMIAFLGLANASRIITTGVGNAPKAMRADQIEPQGLGTRLRYVQCPQAPFIDSTEQNVCEGL